MPQVSRQRIVREKVTTQSQEGEITINLNLKITIDGDSTIKIEAGASPVSSGYIPEARPAPVAEVEPTYKPPEIVPTELFSGEDDLMLGFGQTV